MITGWKYYLGARSKQLEKNAALINSLSPLTVLQRGYSITRRLSNGEIIRRASQLTLDERIAIQLAQGSLEARVEKIIGD
jgi:exodeoxyribonuclease VII large subunit